MDGPEELPHRLVFIVLLAGRCLGGHSRLLLTLIPVRDAARFLLDIVMMVWMLGDASSRRRGAPYEADFGRLMYLFPQAFREWRDPVDMDRDVLLGIWMGWFDGWPSSPYPQAGLGSCGSGIGMAVFFLLLFTLGGLRRALLRIVSSWAAPFPDSSGSLRRSLRPVRWLDSRRPWRFGWPSMRRSTCLSSASSKHERYEG